MSVTAEAVKALRERTGAGMMECKKALVEANGDLEAAAEAMRKAGLAKDAFPGVEAEAHEVGRAVAAPRDQAQLGKLQRHAPMADAGLEAPIVALVDHAHLVHAPIVKRDGDDVAVDPVALRAAEAAPVRRHRG